MVEEELIDFIDWLSEEGIARWYMIDEDVGGEGSYTIVRRYLKDKLKEE